LWRVLPPLIFWSLFYLAWGTLQGQQYGGWFGWLKEVLSGPVEFHLWYLYAIVGIYLFVPFLRNIWSASQDGEKKIYLLFWALVSAWPTIQTLLHIEANILDTYGLDSFFGLVGYLFLGAYLHEVWLRHEERARYWWWNAALFLIFSASTMLATYMWSAYRGGPDALFYDYLSPLVIASSACAFTVLCGLGAKAGDFAGPLKRVSACTLGVYCLHVFVLDALGPLTGLGDNGGWAWIGIPVTAVSVFCVTLAAVWLLRRFRPFIHVT
jgi:surface polysaccharide O-acyltransferase-like enzyme